MEDRDKVRRPHDMAHRAEDAVHRAEDRVDEVVEHAEEVLDEHTEPPPGQRKYAAGSDPESLVAEQRDEAAQSWVGPGLPVMTDAQAKGLVFGALVGGLVGALVFLPLAFIPFIDSVGVRILVVALVGAFAGGTAGGLYMGGREPELEGETLDDDGRPSVGTTLRDPHTDRRGR
jgi:hypothetical protein